MKSREIAKNIVARHDSALGRILVLTGARQTGKTTLARECFKGHTYLSIEDPVLRIQYAALNAQQWKKFYPKGILDEVQKEPRLVESVKAVYDQYPETGYVLLGSSQLLLLQKVKESLAGRCYIQEVFPLTLPEMLTNAWDEEPTPSFFQQYMASKIAPEVLPSFQLYPDYSTRDEIFKYYLNFGGYPALVNKELSDDDRFDWLSNYIRTYLERDIRDLAEFKNLEPFVKFQRMTSLLTGHLVNYAELAKESGVSPKTAQRFLHYLEISYQTLILPPWHKNKLKRMSKSYKLHYLDPGVQRGILRKRGEFAGNEFESAMVAEIYKQARNANMKVSFYHLRTLDGRETDLLLETEDGYIPIEIKMSTNVTRTDARHLSGLGQILDKPVLQSFVLSNDHSIKKLDEKIMALPAAMFLT